MWSFEEPFYLLLLFVVPVFYYFRHKFPGRGGQISLPLSLWGGNHFVPLNSPWLRFWAALSTWAFWIALVLFVIALAGPVLIKREKVYLSPGADIMLVLDESASMAGRDFPPESRFGAARKVIQNFVRARENDAIGLVSFSGEAALRVPPTLDYQFLLSSLDQLKIHELGDGTALGKGIMLAALHLQNSQVGQKVIIILTDGENNSGEVQPETAADIARSLGISLYVIGIGTSGKVPAEFIDPETGQKITGDIQGGFNESLLRRISGGKDGFYFSATSLGSLESIFQSIDSRESTDKRVKIKVVSQPIYPNLMLTGLFLILAWILVRKLLLREVL